MIRLAILSALVLAGCASDPQPPVSTMRTASGAPVISTSANPVQTGSPAAYRAGLGIIESISLVNPPETASAGGTAAPVARGPYRLTLRMDDGKTQTIVVDNRAFLVGDRVQVLPDGKLIRA